jgi:hypothetical protein
MSPNKSCWTMPRSTIDFDTVRNIGLALPGVEESRVSGVPALKVHGKLLACVLRIARPNPLFLWFAWISMTAQSCLLRTPLFTT